MITVQRAAITLIVSGMRSFYSAANSVLRNCDDLESLIGLYATGRTNSSIVQELINLGVGTSSLQSTLLGVAKTINSTLSAQSTSGSIPSDCISQLDDNDDVSPTDSRFTAWYQKCSQYIGQIAMRDIAGLGNDWAKNANVRSVVYTASMFVTTTYCHSACRACSTAPAPPTGSSTATAPTGRMTGTMTAGTTERGRHSYLLLCTWQSAVCVKNQSASLAKTCT